MAGYEKHKDELAELGVRVYAASVDDTEHAAKMARAAGVSFPVAHGVTEQDAERIGAWWDGRRNFIQPSEFVIGRNGRVVSATYSTGPIGRMNADDVISLLKILEARKKAKK